MQLGLTPEQKAERLLGIGGSDATKIMEGDWHDLWLVKTEQKEDDNLTDIFRVQLGNVTEELNLYWLEKHSRLEGFSIPHAPHTKFVTSDYVAVRSIGKGTQTVPNSSDGIPVRCIPDALGYWEIDEYTHRCVVDAKHTNAYADESYLFKKYYWQLTHNAMVCGCTVCIISPIYGNEWGDPIVWELSEEDTRHLIKTEEAFWWHVTSNTPPDDHTPQRTTRTLEDMVKVNMEGNNEWASLAEDFKVNKEAHSIHAKAKKGLRKLVEDDVSLAIGHGVVAKRRKNNNVYITEIKEGTK